MKSMKKMICALLVIAMIVPMMGIMASAADLENKYDSSAKVIGIPPTGRDDAHTSTNLNYYASNLIELQPGDVVYFAPVATNLAYHARTYTPEGAKKDDKVKTGDCEIVEDIVEGISILKYVVPEGTGSMRFAVNQMFGDSFLVTVNQEFNKEGYFAAMEKAGVNVDYFRPSEFNGELVNLFPKSDSAFAGSVNKKGEETANEAYRTSELIPVKGGDVIYFAGCDLSQSYQLVVYDENGAAVEEATTANYVSRYADFGDGFGICAYKVRENSSGVRIVAPAAAYDAGKVFVTVNQPITLDAYNAIMNPEPEVTEPEVTEPEVTEPEVTEPVPPAETGDSVAIFAVVAIISVFGIAIVAKRREN